MGFFRQFMRAWPLVYVIVMPQAACAEIVIHDLIAPVNKEAMLMAETQGRLFRRGGVLVEFLINGKSAGKVLSGGDGRAYLSYRPARPGLYRINVRSGPEEGEGLLLALRKGDGIVFIDAEGALSEDPFFLKLRKGSQAAINAIRKRFPVVCLQAGPLTEARLRAWLREHGFTALPVIAWKNGAVFSEAAAAGFRVRAVIGREEVIDSARDHHPILMSFGEAEDAVEVKDWDEVRKRLR